MKRSWLYITLVMCFTVLAGCSSNDDDPAAYAAGEYGRPVKMYDIAYGQPYPTFTFTYDGRKLTRLDDGTICIDFEYERGELKSVKRYSLHPENYDYPGNFIFERQGRHITVTKTIYEMDEEQSRFYDSGKVSVHTIELDSRDRAVKITNTGVFEYDTNGELVKLEEGKRYHLFSYNKSGSVAKQDIYNLNGEWEECYTFEYDGKPGMISKIDIPTWYCAFSAWYESPFLSYPQCFLFNYAENMVVSEMTSWGGGSCYYKYYDNDYPKSISHISIGNAWQYEIEYFKK